MLSFGDIAPYAARIRDAGAVLICQVQTLKDAREVAAKGAEIVVAQGTEAGGHGATGRPCHWSRRLWMRWRRSRSRRRAASPTGAGWPPP